MRRPCTPRPALDHLTTNLEGRYRTTSGRTTGGRTTINLEGRYRTTTGAPTGRLRPLRTD